MDQWQFLFRFDWTLAAGGDAYIKFNSEPQNIESAGGGENLARGTCPPYKDHPSFFHHGRHHK